MFAPPPNLDGMPVLARGEQRIDFTDEGRGRPVVLIHSSVSGNRQWRALSEELSGHRVLALNLYGYGETTPWRGAARQSLRAQAELVQAVCGEAGEPVSLVGHSFGGSVALTAAGLLGPRVESLVLLEPNPFALLQQRGRTAAYAEIRELHDEVKGAAARGDWSWVAQRFGDYWLGDGAWAAMPERRQAAFIESVPPTMHEWDAVMDEAATAETYSALACRTLVVSDPATRLPIREIVEILESACPQWTFRSLPEGGHMAPLTRPELVNPLVREFLRAPSAADRAR
jgi:pimeloyl-ACP methyl ester carboxylesterase